MKKAWKVIVIASALIGIIVGGGFASGQEALQYFVSFGHYGTAAVIISAFLFAYFGMILTKIGSRMRTTSHEGVIYKLCGPYLGVVADYVIIFTLFSIQIVMIAAAATILNQQFGLPSIIGGLILVVLVMLTVMMEVKRVVVVIGAITPFLIVAVFLVGIYTIFTIDTSFSELLPIATEQQKAVSHWLISPFNYVSFNISVGVAMALVLGGTEEDENVAALGGLVGGIGLGVLIIIIHFAVFSQVDKVAQYEMPLLKIVDNISPIFGVMMSLILFGMVFNTTVSMLYGFTARFNTMQTKRANVFIIITSIITFIASFVGFTGLVSFFYPFIGFLGLVLMVVLVFAPFIIPKKNSIERIENKESAS